MLFNRAVWAEWVTVDNQRLMGLIQASSVNTFLRARDALIDCGFLEYQKGKKGSPNRYKLCSVCSSKNEPQTTPKIINSSNIEPKTELQTELYTKPKTELQTAHINKQNKTKQNKTEDKGKKGGSKAPAKPSNNYQAIIDEFTEDSRIKDALWDFIQMRILKKKVPTDRALQLILNRLLNMSPLHDVQIAILEQSTINGWTDIYPLKNINGQQGSSDVVKNRNIFVDMLKEERDIHGS